ncbi:MAG TPA: hypothetical protein VIL72_07535 [Beijerinckiaceae bacterium]
MKLMTYVRVAALAVATFAAGAFVSPADAEARPRHGWGGHHHARHYAPRVVHRHHFAPRRVVRHHYYAPRRIYRPVRVAAPYWGPRCVIKKRWVATPWGLRKIHRRVCY